MTGTFKALIAGVAGATVLVGAAQAGGFSRGTADTDILFEEGNFNMRAGATVVAPQRGYATINGVAATDGNYTNTYVVPTAAIKLNMTDYARCAGTYTEVYGGSTSFGPQKQEADRIRIGGVQTSNATASTSLGVDEFALTCAAGFMVGDLGVGDGKIWLIGGAFLEQFDYTEATDFGTLTFNGSYTPGFRVGAAFEIPEIALRAQILYRSQVNHRPGGTYTGLVPGALPLGTYTATGAGTTPQSVEAKFQTGVAEGTLVFGSVKWTDWSVIDTLDYTIAGVVPNRNEYFWKDGWTVNAGVGRQFNDWLSGSVSLTWDQGVSTTEDLLTDTWTFATGIQMRAERASLQLGGAISYLTGGSQPADPNPRDANPTGADFAATVNGDWSLALGGRFAVTW